MRVTILAVVLMAGLTACVTINTTPASQSQTPPATSSNAGEQQPVLEAELTMQEKPGLGLLATKNAGTAPITVQGWPKLSFSDPTGVPMAIPVKRELVPGEGPSITLRPGQTAWAGVRLESDDSDSRALNVLSVELPGSAPAKVTIIGTNGQEVIDTTKIKVSSAKVGTLQPITQGVLTFDH
ncbi:DUF4232 domain-containing protein [Lentzea sp.]|uniref:DUF4232 domain-containing protein n=1 Tax=Lentzea sp. TaxID=56099 RepID=UPI002CF4B553|nr:DUF4232 domain-containing protein [Lentzea sp.]HUQ60157.1 DUF4232 domain-containing protein [Lentzea sp.]